VTCVEEVLVAGRGATPHHRLCATNIFRKVGKRWYMIHHHASPYPTSTGGGGGGDSGGASMGSRSGGVTLGDLLAGGGLSAGNGT
jgi:SnoaL-like domain